MVKTAWSCSPNGNPMHAFSHFISRTRYNIITWKRNGLSPFDSEINNTETAITTLEYVDVTDPDVFNELSDLYAKFASLQCLVSLCWAQRAYLLWMDSGDHNTTFFHNSVRIQSHINFISQITNLDGVSVSDVQILKILLFSTILIFGMLPMILIISTSSPLFGVSFLQFLMMTVGVSLGRFLETRFIVLFLSFLLVRALVLMASMLSSLNFSRMTLVITWLLLLSISL